MKPRAVRAIRFLGARCGHPGVWRGGRGGRFEGEGSDDSRGERGLFPGRRDEASLLSR